MTAIGSVQVFDAEPTLRIAVSGEIDLSNVADLQQSIEEALRGVERAVLDLRRVTFMGSEGVRLIYTLSNLMEESERLLVLADPGGIPAQVLSMTRMDERVTLVTDPADVSTS